MGTLLGRFDIGKLTDQEFQSLRQRDFQVLSDGTEKFHLDGSLEGHPVFQDEYYSEFGEVESIRHWGIKHTIGHDMWEMYFAPFVEDQFFMVEYFGGGQDFLAVNRKGKVLYTHHPVHYSLNRAVKSISKVIARCVCPANLEENYVEIPFW